MTWLPPEREQYLAIAALRERYADLNDGLSASEVRVFSQNGEDGVLAEIFSRIGVEHRFFVEFGVEDGVQCNTRFLAEILGWSGVYFEADAEFFARLNSRLANRPDLKTIRSVISPDNVEALFADAGVPTEFDLLSIDIDGQDYWVWRAIEHFCPRVVVIEYNSSLPSEELLAEPLGRSDGWTKTEFFGSSLGAIRSLAENKGYRLVHTDLAGINAFFVREELAGPFVRPALLRGPNFDLLGRRHVTDAGIESYVHVDPSADPT